MWSWLKKNKTLYAHDFPYHNLQPFSKVFPQMTRFEATIKRFLNFGSKCFWKP